MTLLSQKKEIFNGCPAYTVKRMIEKNHCNPRTCDERFSLDVLNTFINSLDKEHLYFTAADINLLWESRKTMDKCLAGGNQAFINSVLSLYQARLKKADSLIVLLLQKPFDFTTAEKIRFANDSSDFASDEIDYKSRWQKWLKYKTLFRIRSMMWSDSTATLSSAMKQEAVHREVVRKTEQRKIKKIIEHPWGFANYVSSLFCNAIASAYDPHTEFMPLAAKENFSGAGNGESYSFGLVFNNNDKDEVAISHIVPGSPAWKSGELNKNDVLLQMQWEGKGVIDLAGADKDEVNALFSDANHNRLMLTVRKVNGLQKTVSLMKLKIREDENFVKSFVLSGEKKIGYILLPGFYSEWEATSGSSCANDVAKEILKLKKEHVEGVILDLRDNGGGSMEEAMQLAGIFIDEGPLGFGREKPGKAYSMKDPNRGTVYDGPLLVMVNGSSASASEFVAGALQDYNRAIISGTRTYGKATMQGVLPVDTNFNPETSSYSALEKAKDDFVKVTLGRIYRVNGSSNQLNGVEPDITFPDITEGIPYREKFVRFALRPDTIRKAAYFTPLTRLPLQQLRDKSAARIKKNATLQLIERSKKMVAEMYNAASHPISMQIDSILKSDKIYMDARKEFDKALAQDSTPVFRADNHLDDKTRLEVDTYHAEFNAKTLKGLERDPYIKESFLILDDYIHFLQ